MFCYYIRMLGVLKFFFIIFLVARLGSNVRKAADKQKKQQRESSISQIDLHPFEYFKYGLLPDSDFSPVQLPKDVVQRRFKRTVLQEYLHWDSSGKLKSLCCRSGALQYQENCLQLLPSLLPEINETHFPASTPLDDKKFIGTMQGGTDEDEKITSLQPFNASQIFSSNSYISQSPQGTHLSFFLLHCPYTDTKCPMETSLVDPREQTSFSFSIRLGNGAFGEVWQAIILDNKYPHKLVVLKRMQFKFNSHPIWYSAVREIYMGLLLNKHPHVARYLEFFEVHHDENQELWLVSVYEGMTLANLLFEVRDEKYAVLTTSGYWYKIKHTSNGPNILKKIMLQLLEAIFTAHNQNIVHRDLKMKNIFVSFVDNTAHIRVGDWGSAILLSASPKEFKMLYGAFPPSSNEETEGMQPPEDFFDNSTINYMRSKSYDMWTLGVMMLQIVLGDLDPFRVQNEAVRIKLEQEARKESPETLKKNQFLLSLSELCLGPSLNYFNESNVDASNKFSGRRKKQYQQHYPLEVETVHPHFKRTPFELLTNSWPAFMSTDVTPVLANSPSTSNASHLSLNNATSHLALPEIHVAVTHLNSWLRVYDNSLFSHENSMSSQKYHLFFTDMLHPEMQSLITSNESWYRDSLVITASYFRKYLSQSCLKVSISSTFVGPYITQKTERKENLEPPLYSYIYECPFDTFYIMIKNAQTPYSVNYAHPFFYWITLKMTPTGISPSNASAFTTLLGEQVEENAEDIAEIKIRNPLVISLLFRGIYDGGNSQTSMMRYSSVYENDASFTKKLFLYEGRLRIEYRSTEEDSQLENKSKKFVKKRRGDSLQHTAEITTHLQRDNTEENNSSKDEKTSVDEEDTVDHLLRSYFCSDPEFDKILKQRDASGKGLNDPLARDFLRRLLSYHPELRMTADEALKHPYIVNIP
ncbi:putative inactive protein kinase [Cardiosporidium cionae]|uniref:Inactive protein kinase n=1 Tax=Cardiosporidium cionae TaxID=476202 RepID=A0ABQ7JBX9_9APIC|nr:putative inactive protein kinase [Cardiosporidium cionae]|eukprot:KAF8821476.1 putative inactive protein kinase [Cardiosporidium cionae]